MAPYPGREPCRAGLAVRREVLARDLISSGREQEIDEIRDFISTIVPDGHTEKPVRGHSDDHPDDAELIRGRMPAAGGNASGGEASAIPVGLAPLIERTFRYAYLLATLKRDEMVDEGRGAEEAEGGNGVGPGVKIGQPPASPTPDPRKSATPMG